MDNASHWIYDPEVHGRGGHEKFRMQKGEFTQQLNASNGCPSGAIQKPGTTELTTYHMEGNGVWASYFEPVSPFHPQLVARSTCRYKPLVRLSFPQILQGLHLSCVHSVRAWRYGGTSEAVTKPHLSDHAWLGENRQRGAKLLHKYYQPNRVLLASVRGANPHSKRLAVHIRHSDKANRRKRIKILHFLPYVQTYLKNVPPSAMVYLATDSSEVMSRIRETWPTTVVIRIHTQDSTSDTA
eukprot:CAMPEP_0168819904 /NCGR_PEP_ID=MMETSP0726-20121227/8549_1 /TAXON_ID=265536 /ORGANISM="Amphiprora sp., Strain CCMP467" /LENGTH=239 /DNA_ID=CAMNT_0008872349 /DNA_START=88 /DNA_END=804 /DNA_ORIENTATION=+